MRKSGMKTEREKKTSFVCWRAQAPRTFTLWKAERRKHNNLNNNIPNNNRSSNNNNNPHSNNNNNNNIYYNYSDKISVWVASTPRRVFRRFHLLGWRLQHL